MIGNNATLVINRESWEVFPETENGQYKVPAIPRQSGGESHELHMKNFIECIKTRKEPACTVENGRLVAAYTHMGNIALRTASQLKWQETTQNFGNTLSQCTPHAQVPGALGIAKGVTHKHFQTLILNNTSSGAALQVIHTVF